MILLSLACNGSTQETASPQQPTFYEDVAPVLADNCVSCHQTGEIAPFPLVSYEDTVLVANAVADSVQERRMPPWLAKDDGSCTEYKHSVWLEDEDLQTIVDWVQGDQLEGDPANAPALPDPQPSLDDYTHSLALTDVYVPDFGGESDDYRCFIIDPGFTHDTFINAFEVVPGNDEVVHHVITYVPSSQAALADAYERDDADPGDGYTCFGGPNVDAFMASMWAPGKNVWEYPPGTGVPVDAGMPHIVQVHYNDTGSEEGDATEVRYRTVDEVDGWLYPWFLVNSDLNIPPNTQGHVESATHKMNQWVGFGDFTLTAVGPHMHKLGTGLKASAKTRDGEEHCLIDVPRWDFNWQMAYEFVEPIEMSGGTEVTLECTFDSSGVDSYTHWGDGTGDEMCLLTMFSVFEPF